MRKTNDLQQLLAQYDVNDENVKKVLDSVAKQIMVGLQGTYSSKLVNFKDEEGYKEAISYIFNVMLLAHNLDKYDTSLNGYDLGQFKVDPTFKFLSIPRFVGFNGDSFDTDLMVHYSAPDEVDAKPSLFMEAQEIVLQAFKRDANFSSTLADFVPVIAFAAQAASNSARFDDGDITVHCPDGGMTIPVIMPMLDMMVKSSYFTESLDEYLSIWVSTVVVPSLRVKQ